MSPERRATIELVRLAQELRHELNVIDQLRERLERFSGPPVPGLVEEAASAALAVALHGYYGAIESLLTRIARVVEGGVPTGPDWHRDLLRAMSFELPNVRPAVISLETTTALLQLLSFRHFFRHAYAVSFDRERLLEHVRRVLGGHARLRTEIEAFAGGLLEVGD